jgi:hypothetical protein
MQWDWLDGRVGDWLVIGWAGLEIRQSAGLVFWRIF